MKIKMKLGVLILAVSVAFVSSIALYIIITSPIEQILDEQQILESFSYSLNTVMIETSNIPNAVSLNKQSGIFNAAIDEMQEGFSQIKELKKLAQSSLKIQIALETIQSRETLILLQVDIFKDIVLKLLDQGKRIFTDADSISILGFYDYYKKNQNNMQDSVYFNISLLFNQINVLNKNILDSVNTAKTELIIIEEEISKIQSNSMLISLITVLIVLTSGILFSFIVSSTITKSIKKIEGNIVLLKEGNLTTEFNIKSRDEIGTLSTNLDSFLSSLSSSIIRIKESSSKNLNIKDELVNSVNQTSSSLEQMDSGIKSIEKQIEMLDDDLQVSLKNSENIFHNIDGLNNQLLQQNAMTEETSSAITEMITSLDNIAKITLNRKETTDQLVLTAENGGEKLENTVEIINDINQGLGSISEVSKIIQGIAAQTNLLALNAAIEAAHAGEAGKGFSVVSQEIRKLAEAANTQSKKISTDIQDIIQKIEHASESSIETDYAFKKINNETKTVNDSLIEIFSSMDEIQTGSKQILEAIKNLREISVNVKDASTVISNNSTETANYMKNIKDISSSVRSSIEEISIGISEISIATNKTNDLSGEMSKISENLDQQVNKFKTDTSSLENIEKQNASKKVLAG